MREKDIEKKLVSGIRKLGGVAFKFVSPGNDGVPDRLVILPGKPPIFVELKKENSKLSGLQKVQIRRLRQDLGQPCAVLYGEDQVRGFLAACRLGRALDMVKAGYWL